MSEYWKSTPKYWCKHCKTFVRDTKLEKTNHEATPKHQGNLKRFLRDLHKEHDREERDKQRAKDEVDRLNGVVSRSGSKPPPWEKKIAAPASSGLRQATPADRKKQLAQLAEMGVAVPEDFRKEMAMVGDWQTTSQRLIYDTMKEDDDSEDVKPNGLNIGVRKRKFEGQEEEEEVGEAVVKRGWGSTVRTYPEASDGDLDDLLKRTKVSKRDPGSIDESARLEPGNETPAGKGTQHTAPGPAHIKREESLSDTATTETALAQDARYAAFVKQEDDNTVPEVVFKKRKAKPIRQK